MSPMAEAAQLDALYDYPIIPIIRKLLSVVCCLHEQKRSKKLIE